MLPENYRRLWQRRFRRRPLLPFLLLATVAVNAVAIATLFLEVGHQDLVEGIAAAWIAGQMQLVAVWTVWHQRGFIARALCTLIACPVLAKCFHWSSDNYFIDEYPIILFVFCCGAICTAVATSILLWINRAIAKDLSSVAYPRWRFTVVNLLGLMTIVAIFALVSNDFRGIDLLQGRGLLLAVIFETAFTMWNLIVWLVFRRALLGVILSFVPCAIIPIFSSGSRYDLAICFIFIFFLPQWLWLYGLIVRPRQETNISPETQMFETESIDTTV